MTKRFDQLRAFLAFVLTAWSIASCSSTSVGGDGSESHFLSCNVDGDCAALGTGYRCENEKCAESPAPASLPAPGAMDGRSADGSVTRSAGADSGPTACANDTTAMPFSAGMHESSGGTTVAIDSNPPLPAVGDQGTWTLTVTDSGSPVAAGTKVSVVCTMTHAGMLVHGCPTAITVKDLGGGVYEATPVIFNMQGHWRVSIAVGSTVVRFELCVDY
jgi:hypothetical protein